MGDVIKHPARLQAERDVLHDALEGLVDAVQALDLLAAGRRSR